MLITGYDAVSLQPNAGSQGEYAGLLAIHEYHASRGEPHRDICLIPSSAHGTNAASAALAGMRVVVVDCHDNGDVDLDDLRAKVGEHAERLSALMITYPSTHGVYEHDIAEICAAVHDAGGQVYVDGANLNALVGLAGRASSAVTSVTSTYTRHSAFRTAAVAQASARWRCGRTWHRFCQVTPSPPSCPRAIRCRRHHMGRLRFFRSPGHTSG